ncbi:hypothetical protein [Hymenobacter siberiensis]|jgi:hypothetical protein|uniref:hypothetical protein n=1 Tax=Hymenobacter siberiensis TaxID=2848396 RepID=UPI001C1DFF08|nr:hypothetical protein [Hymenobacter siberiensis]MBU6121552.1 hypothetical protein [Hymenobacter siberiensis]
MSDNTASLPNQDGLVFRQNTHNPPLRNGLTPRQRVQQAAFYGHDVRNDPERRAAYGQHTDEILRSPYSVAVADYLNAPNITNVDFSNYHGRVGDDILVQASDDFAIHHVHVLIQNPDGSTVEEGNAVAESDGTTFRYVATAHNDSLAGDKITVTTADYPGNETTKQEVL